jgi:hypothetical protein
MRAYENGKHSSDMVSLLYCFTKDEIQNVDHFAELQDLASFNSYGGV